MPKRSLSLCGQDECTFALGHSTREHSPELPNRGPGPSRVLRFDERLEMRLTFIENVLRANNLHTNYCDLYKVQQANKLGGAYWYDQPCTCWIATV